MEEKHFPSDVNHPKEFCCPISLDLMTDPVLLIGDGHTYEREELQKWLQSNNTSPITNETLESKQFCSNFALKYQIDEYKIKFQAQETKKFIRDLFAPCNHRTVNSSPTVKIQMTGDSNTGKTSFVKFSEFSENQPTMVTMGLEIKYLKLIKPYREKTIAIQITDVPGVFDRYKNMMKSVYRGIHGCILMCSIDDGESVESLEKNWNKEVCDYAPDSVYCVVLLNKYDLLNNETDQEKILQYERIEKQARKFANDNGYPLYTTSCLSGAYVHSALKELVDRIVRDAELWKQLLRDISRKSILYEIPKKKKKSWYTC
eukprot:199960_1